MAEKESRTVSRIFEQERFTHEYTKVLLNTAIQLVTKGKSDQVYVSTGLPLDFFNAQKDEFRQSIIGLQPLIEWKSGELKGQKLKTNIRDAIVLPQGASAMFSALINSEGRFTYPHLMVEGNMMALIDVGFRTTDYVVVEIQKDSSFTPNVRLSGTLDVGIVNLHEEIKQYYKRETGGADLNESHLSRILANQQITYKGRRISFREMIVESMNSIATNISDRLKATWVEEADLFDAIFIAGGGGKMLEPVLQPKFGNRLELIAENQFANVIGYLRLGNKFFSRN